jgi:zona occludens toxin
MIQSIADLHRSIKAVVELSFRMVKLKSVGLSKGYRVEMYETSKQTKAMQTGTFIRKYRPEIFPLYNSYAGGAGVESTVDARQNVFARKSFWIVGAVVLVLGVVSVFFVWRFFHERLAKGSVPGPVIGSSSSAVRPAGGGLSGPAAAVAASSAVSDTWRLVGSVFAHGARYVVMVDDKGRLRVGSPGGFVGEGIARVGWVDGRRVMAWSGPPEVAPAHAAPSLSAAAGVGK